MKLKYVHLDSQELFFAGRRISQFLTEDLETPLYIYSHEIIERKIKELRLALPAEIEINFAIKANPMPALLQFMTERVDGFDVASGGELQRALQTKMSPENISFSGPGKTDSEIEFALKSKILINAESINEIRRIGQRAKVLDVRPRVALRINPPFESKLGGMKMGGGAKPFGIDSENLSDVFAEMQKLQIPIEGLHVFAGSQMLSSDGIIEMQNKTFDLLFQIKSFLKTDFKSFNIGGGFGIPYFEGDTDLNLTEIGQNLKTRTSQFKVSFPNSKVVIELGRFLVGESGLFLCRIVEKKVSRGQTFLVLDGGMNGHLAASGNLGQVIKRPFPILAVTRILSSDNEEVSIVGPLCTPLDMFAQRLSLPRCEVGDLIGIMQSGAYGLTASPIHFLSHESPKEIFV